MSRGPLVGEAQLRADVIELGYLLDVLDRYDAEVAVQPDSVLRAHYRAQHVEGMRRRVPVLVADLAYSVRVMVDAEIHDWSTRMASWAIRTPLERAVRMALLITYPERLEELL